MNTQAVIKASELQRSSGKVLKRVAVGNEHLVIERAGYPVAVMISFQEYEALMRDRALAAHHDLDDWQQLSVAGLSEAYGDDEPEYSTSLIKEPNPTYERE